jgi:hypothetical protein
MTMAATILTNNEPVGSMAAGTLLRIYQHLKRLGITATVGSHTIYNGVQTYKIETHEGWYVYEEGEIVQLAQQAQDWKAGQQEQEILW